jgi:hypothetical protein
LLSEDQISDINLSIETMLSHLLRQQTNTGGQIAGGVVKLRQLSVSAPAAAEAVVRPPVQVAGIT